MQKNKNQWFVEALAPKCSFFVIYSLHHLLTRRTIEKNPSLHIIEVVVDIGGTKGEGEEAPPHQPRHVVGSLTVALSMGGHSGGRSDGGDGSAGLTTMGTVVGSKELDMVARYRRAVAAGTRGKLPSGVGRIVCVTFGFVAPSQVSIFVALDVVFMAALKTFGQILHQGQLLEQEFPPKYPKSIYVIF